MYKRQVENVFSLIFVSIGNAVSPYVSQNLGAQKIGRIKKGYHAADVYKRQVQVHLLVMSVFKNMKAAYKFASQKRMDKPSRMRYINCRQENILYLR